MNTMQPKSSPMVRGIMVLAALVVIVAGMMAAKAILIPLMLAVFIAVICSGPVAWLEKRGLPCGLALLLVLGLLCVAAVAVAMVVGGSINDFIAKIPYYEAKLQGQSQQFQAFLARQGVDLKDSGIQSLLDPGVVMKYVGVLLKEALGLVTSGFLILLLVVFFALEAKGLPAKFRFAYGDKDKTIQQFGAFGESVNHYMAIKTAMSLGTGVAVSVSLWIIGLDYPFMWGLLAFAFNFIPNIGSFLAAIPAVLLAIIQLDLVSSAFVAGAYVVINVVIGNAIEPRFMGRKLGLSPSVVFCSLLFWGWVFGPVGMLLSVALTMLIKLMLESAHQTKPIALLLGPNPDELKHPAKKSAKPAEPDTPAAP
ncbi:MAG: AI-2E family transporter [Phycisphaerales bacterium]|nr:AI-2E family transporter [Phycisphaerales bacterium]MBT7170181.1 AI-2E family transporter [Phycisphaerales bacterium]